MKRLRTVVRLHPVTNASLGRYDPVGQEIKNYKSIRIKTSISERKKDTFSITLPNDIVNQEPTAYIGREERTSNLVRIKDQIFIYAYYDDIPDQIADYLLMAGFVTDIEEKLEEKGNVITIRGANATEMILKGNVPATFLKDDATSTPPLIIKQLLDRLNANLPDSSKITYELSSDTTKKDVIRTVNSDGEAFDSIAYNQVSKPAFAHIDELSNPEFTGDFKAGRYIFGVTMAEESIDNSGGVINKFFWRPKDFTVTGTLTEGTDFRRITVKKNTLTSVNAVYISLGKDLNDDGVATYALNTESMVEIGPKWDFLNMTHMFSLVANQEQRAGEADGASFGEDGYPSSFPYTFRTIFKRDSFGNILTPLQTITATNRTEYNNTLRGESRARGKQAGDSAVKVLGEPRWEVKIDLGIGTNIYTPGDIFTIVSPTVGWDGTTSNPGRDLRIVGIEHKINKKGWNTVLNLKEDEKIISSSFEQRLPV